MFFSHSEFGVYFDRAAPTPRLTLSLPYIIMTYATGGFRSVCAIGHG